MDIDLMVNKIHLMAKEKGWWPGPRPADELVMLIITELAEASEEARKGTPAIWANVTNPGIAIKLKATTTTDLEIIKEYNLKPEGELIEIADACIRVMDVAGSMDLCLSGLMSVHERLKLDRMDSYNHAPLEAHFRMVQTLASSISLTRRLARFMVLARRYADARFWDLDSAIELKVAFNATRPARHGGKKF